MYYIITRRRSSARSSNAVARRWRKTAASWCGRAIARARAARAGPASSRRRRSSSAGTAARGCSFARWRSCAPTSSSSAFGFPSTRWQASFTPATCSWWPSGSGQAATPKRLVRRARLEAALDTIDGGDDPVVAESELWAVAAGLIELIARCAQRAGIFLRADSRRETGEAIGRAVAALLAPADAVDERVAVAARLYRAAIAAAARALARGGDAGGADRRAVESALLDAEETDGQLVAVAE